ncbi:TerB family tellurite resistance protein [Fulvivirga lutimaris]|uniref:TerB family tellurite resistance protein n=1 Tax=Fulvivirga lutimaris TaxID=1819566 RepID=UPI0012BC1B26|nr:TerB family tellurite resistance protein [Fulvivirga lutimaris]MTI41635.1 TerB family tellurite resistance protein [Fulvivirga lutimaris]
MKDNPHLNILVMMAKIDGETDHAELELIRQIGTSSNVSSEDIEEIIETTKTDHNIPSLSNLTKEQKIELMTNLVLVMKIDGRIAKEEMKFCFQVIKKMGYNEEALFDLVSTTYLDPKQAINKEEIKQRAEQYLN